MAEHIYITGGSTIDARVNNTVDTNTRINGSVEVDLSAFKIGLGIVLGFLFCLIAFKIFVIPSEEKMEKLFAELNQDYAPKRLVVQGVDCVVINRNAISCDWNKAQPYTQGEK